MISWRPHPPDQQVITLNVVIGWAEELTRRVPTN